MVKWAFAIAGNVLVIYLLHNHGFTHTTADNQVIVNGFGALGLWALGFVTAVLVRGK